MYPRCYVSLDGSIKKHPKRLWRQETVMKKNTTWLGNPCSTPKEKVQKGKQKEKWKVRETFRNWKLLCPLLKPHAQGKMFREPRATVPGLAHPSPANSLCRIPNGPALVLLGGPAGAQLPLPLLSGMWPASEPRRAELEGSDAPETDEDIVGYLLWQLHKWLCLPPGGVWRQAAAEGSSPLCRPRDEPEDLPPLLHTVHICRLEHHPPGGLVLRTVRAAERPGSLFPAGGGRGRASPRECGLRPEELLPKNLPLSARQAIQPLCLGDGQSRNHETLVFINDPARKIQEQEVRPRSTWNWFPLTNSITLSGFLPCQRLSFLLSCWHERSQFVKCFQNMSTL